MLESKSKCILKVLADLSILGVPENLLEPIKIYRKQALCIHEVLSTQMVLIYVEGKEPKVIKLPTCQICDKTFNLDQVRTVLKEPKSESTSPGLD